jgi:putative CocE/NonD family hydrolase
LRFLDWHLKGRPNGIEVEKPVHYYTMGEEAWKEAGEWPPRGYAARSFYLAENGSLELAQPTGPGADHYRVDYTASSGPNSRWSSMVNFKTMKTIYPDRAEQDQRLLVYQTAPLERALEVTGHPVLTLYLRSSAPDANLIVYLEEVTKAGEVRYVTEGWFRALHRKVQLQPHPHGLPVPVHSFCRADALPLPSGEVAAVSFDLLPTSYLFRIGNRIRLAIAGADAANVLPLSLEPPEFEVQRGAPYASHLRLPVKEWASGSIRRITG